MTCQPDELLSSKNQQQNLWLESAVNLFLMVRIPSHQPGDHMTKTLLCLLLWVTYLCAFSFLVLFNFFHVCPKVFLYFFIFIKSFFSHFDSLLQSKQKLIISYNFTNKLSVFFETCYWLLFDDKGNFIKPVYWLEY